MSALQVYYRGALSKVLVGRLAYINHKIFFEYSPEFLNLGLEISPYKLPLKREVISCDDATFDGLFGVFNDSLPDGWGRLLLDRKLMTLGMNPDALTPLERLRYVGTQGMGALSYEPEYAHAIPSSNRDLDEIAMEVFNFQTLNENQYVDDLLAMNGSSAGARPKILVSLMQNKDWIIKFKSSLDPVDIGPIEYAYHLMAKQCGLDVPEAQIFPSKHSYGYFGVQRFDRLENKFIHTHTLSGLLHADHRYPALDYETLIKVTLWLTKNVHEGEKQFRNAVFNVLSHNRDDHSKNFSFLMDEKGIWKIAPAYDLTFSSGPAGEHCMAIMREGKNPTLAHLLKLADVAGLEKQKAHQIIAEVQKGISKWTQWADQAGVSKESSKRIKTALEYVTKH